MSQMGELSARTANAVLFKQHGETIAHWPAGVEASAVNVTAIVDRTEQVSEFAAIETQAGRKIPKRAILSLATSVTVTVTEEPRHNSRFVFDGEAWWAERILSVEAGVQDVQVKNADGVHVNRSR